MKIKEIRAFEIELKPKPTTPPRVSGWTESYRLNRPVARYPQFDKPGAHVSYSDWKRPACLVIAEDGTWGFGISLYGPPVVSLINDPTLTSLMSPLKIDAFVNPRATTVSSILRHVRHGRVRNVYSIGDAEAEVIEAQVMSPSPLADQRIRDIQFPEGVLVGALQKGNEVIKPVGATKIEEGDVITLFCMASDVPEVERLLQVSIDFF